MVERIMEILVDSLRIVNGTYIDGHEEAAQKIVEALKPVAQQPQAKIERGTCGNCGQKCEGFDETAGCCGMWVMRSASEGAGRSNC